MKYSLPFALLAVSLFAFTLTAGARDVVVPAGTLLQCTLNEPNLSSKTVDVGDPVLCHLRGISEFGQQAFPRGSYLIGHVEAEKDPGHFVGKGYLKLQFDRIGVPSGDLPLEAKVISTRGYKVDKQGKIDGKGHAKRDVVEWMLPPLWPWKVIMLPARGPRPTLKGEEPLELRLMDDIVIPRTLAYGPAANSNRPPWASSKKPSAMNEAQPGSVEPAVEKSVRATLSETTPAVAREPVARVTNLVLKSNVIYEVSKYRVNGDVLEFVELNGTRGAVDVNDVDWRKTTEMTSQMRSVDLPVLARQTN